MFKKFIIAACIVSLIIILFNIAELFLKYGGDFNKYINQYKNIEQEQNINLSSAKFVNLNDKITSLDDKNYKIIMLWTSWCKYCMGDLIALNKISKQHKLNFKILPIAAPDEELGKLQNYKLKFKLDNIELYFDKYKHIFPGLNAKSVPYYVILNADNKLIAEIKPDWGRDNIIKLMNNIIINGKK